MAVPALPMPHFIVIQPDLPFGQFNGFFHLPPAASRSHNLFQANLLRGEDEVVGDLGGIGQTAPGEQPLLPPRLGPPEGKLLPRPIVEARPLTAFSWRQALPPLGRPTGHDRIGAVSEPDALILWHG